MRTHGDSIILEGRESPAFRALLQRLIKDQGVLTAERKTWQEFPGLAEDSKGAISAAAMRTCSTFLLMRRLRPNDVQLVLLEDAITRNNIIREPGEQITSKGVEPRKVLPGAIGTVQIAGIARPHGTMLKFLTRTSK